MSAASSHNCVLLENSLPQFFERTVTGEASKFVIELLKPQRKSPSDKLIQLFTYSFAFTYSVSMFNLSISGADISKHQTLSSDCAKLKELCS